MDTNCILTAITFTQKKEPACVLRNDVNPGDEITNKRNEKRLNENII
jgi:hypothetical protein